MLRITRIEQLHEALQRLKRQRSGFITSFFSAPYQAEQWFERGVLHGQDWGDAVLLFRRDRNFYRIYHLAAGSGALKGALEQGSDDPEHSTIAADLVGHESNVTDIAAIYRSVGFHEHLWLMRMSCAVADLRFAASNQVEIQVAAEKDASAALDFLSRHLDPLAEQIPPIDELRLAAARGDILQVRIRNRVVGVLVGEITGVTAMLRYWFVHPDMHNQGIGSGLIRAFFERVKGCKRIVLWVIASNHDEIGRASCRERVCLAV